MHHLVYFSTASVLLTEEELHQQVAQWREKNARLDVTGVLLYSEGNILQVLEGAAATVQPLFAAIAADVRHRGVTKLADGPVPGRAFANWSMQMKSVEIADFTRLLQQQPGSGHAKGLMPLLEAFLLQEA